MEIFEKLHVSTICCWVQPEWRNVILLSRVISEKVLCRRITADDCKELTTGNADELLNGKVTRKSLSISRPAQETRA